MACYGILDLFRNLVSKGINPLSGQSREINKGLKPLETFENKGYGTGLFTKH